MSEPLKHSLKKKMDISPSAEFDSHFFKKLEKQKKRPFVFSSWLSLTLGGCLTASILLFAITGSHLTNRYSMTYNQESIDSFMEMENNLDEDLSNLDTPDLTTAPSDEI